MEWHTAQILEDMQTWFRQWNWSDGLRWIDGQTGPGTGYIEALEALCGRRERMNIHLPPFRVLGEECAESVFTKVTWMGHPEAKPQTRGFNRQRLLDDLWALVERGGIRTNRLLNVLSRHCSDLVAEVEGQSGTVMFFDLLKLRLSRTSCRLVAGDAMKPYLFVGGDLSGIQNFIYTVHPKGALKTLRGRSFFLQLVMVDFADQVLRELNLEDFHQVYVGGGGCYLLLPNTSETLRVLTEVSAAFNEWALRTLQGKLFLAVGWVEMGDDDFSNSAIWGEVARELGRAKSGRYLDKLSEEGPANPLTPREAALRECQVCRTDENPVYRDEGDGGEERWLCSFCKQMEHLGRHLPRAWGIGRGVPEGRRPSPSVEVCCRTYRLILRKDSPDGPDADWAVKDSERVWIFLRQDADLLSCDRVMVPPGYAITDEDGEFWTFERLADESKGDKRLGVLRMDVDNLGQIFARGMSAEDRVFANVSALSRALSGFFSETLNALCEKDREKGGGKFHVVYAGGDDLFMVGSWNDLASFALTIEQEFSRYTGRNPGITLSGGLIVADYHVPLYHLAEWAGEAEEWAKDRGKNRVAMFFSPRYARSDTLFPVDVPWEKLRQAKQALLEPLMQVDLPRRFILYSRSYPDLAERDAAHFAQYLYRIARLRVPKDQKEAWGDIKRKLVNREFYPTWRVIFTWLALWTREVSGDAVDETAR